MRLLPHCSSPPVKNKSATTASTIDSTAIKAAKNKWTALTAMLAFNNHKVDRVFKDCSADFEERGDNTGKPMKNLDSIKMNLKNFLTAFPDFGGEKLNAVSEGDSVVITGIWRGTFKADYMKMKANGKTYKAPDADIFTFNKAGKITSHSSVQSDATFSYLLDLPMPPKKK